MKSVRLIVLLVLCCGLFYGLEFKHGQLPQIGNFFSPFSGFLQNGRAGDELPETLNLDGLQETVMVVWDDRHIPHIFAQNNSDLYFAQGYITARDRLWQMDFFTRGAAGRLSEVLGSGLLEYDRRQRRLGLGYGAEQYVNAILADPDSKARTESYRDGVNAFIISLSAKNLPFEYKMLDFKPEQWTVHRSALVLKAMTQSMTAYNREFRMTFAKQLYGEDEMAKLFPQFNYKFEPIIPKGTKWNFKPELPEKPAKNFNFMEITRQIEDEDKSLLGVGSNNWAVSGEKTESGYPILSNDPHLQLGLPSTWYEIQLHAPGVNVYGATLPGVQHVITGFNENVAWGVTNGGSDVLDYYLIELNEDYQYKYNGEWRETKTRLEEIKIRGAETVIDTVLYTHYGPVVYRKGDIANVGDVAMRWTAHDESEEHRAFYLLNRAKNYQDYEAAIKYFDTPGQNIVFADNMNNIAITHSGKLPIRWKEQGRYLSDGSDPAYDWGGWIPREHNPKIVNPMRGYVSSANQIPVDEKYPYYLGSSYAGFTRGARINQLLESMDNITLDDISKMQLDDVDLYARELVSDLLGYLEVESLSEIEAKAVSLLNGWEQNYSAELSEPMIFSRWTSKLLPMLWDEETFRTLRPGFSVTIDLIKNDPETSYFNSKDGEITLASLINDSYHEAVKSLRDDYGDDIEGWKWKNRGTDVRHLARIPALSRMNLPTSGTASTINAQSKSFGPSWRMVVELGPNVKAKTVYPGGQSGNPGSQYYDNMMAKWLAGEQYNVHFLRSLSDIKTGIVGVTELKGAQK